MTSKDANATWLYLLIDLVDKNLPTVMPRLLPTREIIGYQSRIPMTRPVVTIAARDLGYRFMAAEAAWILSGDNRVETIRPYSKKIAEFSDDGVTFDGAYGPPVIDQLGYVIESIRRDPFTRQAVLTIWRQRPNPSLDIPCTVALQWLYRDGLLHCNATMRSSDVWLGWPYDVFNFTMISLYVALRLREVNVRPIGLGCLTLTAGSQHLYERNLDAARRVLDDPASGFTASLQPLEFYTLRSEDLASHLWAIARRDRDAMRSVLLQELVTKEDR